MPRIPLPDIDYLRVLQDYYARHQVFPSYEALAEVLGFKSKSSVATLLERLRSEGYIEAKDRRLRPGARFFERELMPSRVAAGLPAMAFDALSDTLAIDAHLVKRPSKTFLLVIKGDSMIDAGLMPGDTIVVEKNNTAKIDDIVVVFMNDGYTVKRLIQENRKFVLKSENKAYAILRPDPLEIVGVVVGSFRKYR